MNEFYDLMVCYCKSCSEDHYYFRSLKNAHEVIKQHMERQGHSPLYSYEEFEKYMKENDVFQCICGDEDYILTKCSFED